MYKEIRDILYNNILSAVTKVTQVTNGKGIIIIE